MPDVNVLRATELFASLSEAALAKIVTTGSTHQLERGDTLFDEGAEPDQIYVVTSGRIAMVNRSIDGRESVVALMEPGDLFGEMPLFDGGKRSAEARALEHSEVVAIPYAPLRRLYQRHPNELWGVVKLLVARLRATDATLADSVFLDVTGRTAKRLLELAGDKDEFTLPITQEELAGIVGASRERVNKAISAFVRLNWITLTDRRYTITNREQLTIRAR
ncbi:MAG: Crp/Fnr family transcriptional regulator [Acidimicrobiia bacterium]|nr:Crp/Fnr family transcriptional regulator [Acidimicrobiia bacterium]MCY4456597.1 Crp/Fnr family transcriptional regulator [Acidimicrobiaceae bacterium]